MANPLPYKPASVEPCTERQNELASAPRQHGEALLAAWDLQANTTSRGAALWRAFWLRAMHAPDLWSVPFDPARPMTPVEMTATPAPTAAASNATRAGPTIQIASWAVASSP